MSVLGFLMQCESATVSVWAKCDHSNPLTPGYTLPVNTEALDYWSRQKRYPRQILPVFMFISRLYLPSLRQPSPKLLKCASPSVPLDALAPLVS